MELDTRNRKDMKKINLQNLDPFGDDKCDTFYQP
jgi:hypothetical protein